MPELVPIRAWVPVRSSNVRAIWYDPEKELLLISFQPAGRRERRYAYNGVPMRIFLSFIHASSKGKFVWESIRDHYTYVEI